MKKIVLLCLVAAPAIYGSQPIDKVAADKTDPSKNSESVVSILKKTSILPDLVESHISKKYLANFKILEFLRKEVGALCTDLPHTNLDLYNNQPLTHNISMASFNNEGTQFVTCAYNNTAPIIWDVETGKRLHTLQCSNTLELAEINLPGRLTIKVSAQFNRLGTRVITVCGNAVQIWHVKTGQCLQTLYRDTSIDTATINQDETRLVTRTKRSVGYGINPENDNTAFIWNLETGKCLHSLQHDYPVLGALFNNTESQIITKTSKAAHIWNVETGECLHSLSPNSFVHSVIVNNAGTLIITCSEDKPAKIWDAKTGKCLHMLQHNYVNSAEFNSTGTRALTCSEHKTVKIWNVETGECEHSLQHDKHLDRAAFACAGKRIVTMTHSHIYIWNVETGKCVHTLDHPVLLDKPVGIEGSLNDTKTRIITKGQESKNVVKIWDVLTGKCIYSLKSDYEFEEFLTAVFNTTGTRVITASACYSAKIWDLEFIEQTCRWLTIIEGFLIKEIS